MKNIFLATTALVATAGFAAAEVSFSGDASMGLKYGGADWAAHYETTLYAAMSGETDGGLSFGADLTLTYSADALESGKAGVDAATVVYIEGGFGKLSVGDVDNAIQTVTGLGDIGWDGIGTDNIAEGLRGSSAANMLYEGTFADFTGAVSYDMGGTEDWGVGVKYVFMDNYSVALGYSTSFSGKVGSAPTTTFATRQNEISAQLGATFGDIALAALYSVSKIDDAGNGLDGETASELGLTAGYTMGATTITAAYSEANVTGGNWAESGFGVGVAYDLGGGASVKAGVGELTVNGTSSTVADFGISMSF